MCSGSSNGARPTDAEGEGQLSCCARGRPYCCCSCDKEMSEQFEKVEAATSKRVKSSKWFPFHGSAFGEAFGEGGELKVTVLTPSGVEVVYLQVDTEEEGVVFFPWTSNGVPSGTTNYCEDGGFFRSELVVVDAEVVS